MNVITYTLCVLFRGPIAPGDYQVRSAMVRVSYPDKWQPWLNWEFPFPSEWSTQFDVTWSDPKGKDVELIRRGAERISMVTHKAFDFVNELLINFKLVTLGHSDSHGIRTFGDGDLIFDKYKIDEEPEVPFRMMIMPVQLRRGDLVVSNRARGHLSANTFPVGRRLVRCVELYEHGFYPEAFIIAFSILDDVVQRSLYEQLEKAGMTDETERQDLVRGIEKSRLKIYLGPMLKLASGIEIQNHWNEYPQALDWLNRKRNGIAHKGETVDRSSAARAIFVSVKLVYILHFTKLIDAAIPKSLLRLVCINAAWTDDPPSWCPSQDELKTLPSGPELLDDLLMSP